MTFCIYAYIGIVLRASIPSYEVYYHSCIMLKKQKKTQTISPQKNSVAVIALPARFRLVVSFFSVIVLRDSEALWWNPNQESTIYIPWRIRMLVWYINANITGVFVDGKTGTPWKYGIHTYMDPSWDWKLLVIFFSDHRDFGIGETSMDEFWRCHRITESQLAVSWKIVRENTMNPDANHGAGIFTYIETPIQWPSDVCKPSSTMVRIWGMDWRARSSRFFR